MSNTEVNPAGHDDQTRCCAGTSAGGTSAIITLEYLRCSELDQANRDDATSKSHVLSQIHATPNDGLLLTSIDEDSLADSSPGPEAILNGLVASVPFKFKLHFESNMRDLSVKLDMTLPFTMRHLWRFRIAPNVTLCASEEWKPSVDQQQESADDDDDDERKRLDWWCVAKCGGFAITECLVTCLPTLADPTAGTYAACLATCAGPAAASMAFCIATECVN